MNLAVNLDLIEDVNMSRSPAACLVDSEYRNVMCLGKLEDPLNKIFCILGNLDFCTIWERRQNVCRQFYSAQGVAVGHLAVPLYTCWVEEKKIPA